MTSEFVSQMCVISPLKDRQKEKMQRQISSQDTSGYLHKVFGAEHWTNLEVLMNWKNLEKNILNENFLKV